MTAHNPDTREKLLELAERCEAATGPDFALDCDIARAMGYCVPDLPTGSIPSPVPSPIWRYTASLDAAMTLIGDGCFECGNLEGAWARVIDGSKNGFFAEAATPALALCAAALRSLSTPSMKE